MSTASMVFSAPAATITPLECTHPASVRNSPASPATRIHRPAHHTSPALPLVIELFVMDDVDKSALVSHSRAWPLCYTHSIKHAHKPRHGSNRNSALLPRDPNTSGQMQAALALGSTQTPGSPRSQTSRPAHTSSSSPRLHQRMRSHTAPTATAASSPRTATHPISTPSPLSPSPPPSPHSPRPTETPKCTPPLCGRC